MRSRGNCHENAVAESFFSNLKERKSEELNKKLVQVRCKICLTVYHCSTTHKRQTNNGHLATKYIRGNILGPEKSMKIKI